MSLPLDQILLSSRTINNSLSLKYPWRVVRQVAVGLTQRLDARTLGRPHDHRAFLARCRFQPIGP